MASLPKIKLHSIQKKYKNKSGQVESTMMQLTLVVSLGVDEIRSTWWFQVVYLEINSFKQYNITTDQVQKLDKEIYEVTYTKCSTSCIKVLLANILTTRSDYHIKKIFEKICDANKLTLN